MIIVNATMKPIADKKEEIIKKAETVIAASRTHHGNISYNLYSDIETGNLMFVEKWESKEALQKHMQTDEFVEFGQETKDLVDGDLGIDIYYAELLSNSADVKNDVKEIRIYYQ